MKEKSLYLYVSDDEYELPLIVEESAAALARRNNTSTKYKRVKVYEDEDE